MDGPEDLAEQAVEAWKEKIGVKWLPRPAIGCRMMRRPPTVVPAVKLKQESQQRKRKVAKDLEEEREGNYVVVYRRASRGTLHRLGQKGCWVRDSLHGLKSTRSCRSPKSTHSGASYAGAGVMDSSASPQVIRMTT